MSYSLKTGETIEITKFCPNPDFPQNTYTKLPAKVLEVFADGSAQVELFYYSSFLGVPRYMTLQPGTFNPVELHPFDVTVSRTGLAEGILAPNGYEAKKLVDNFFTEEDVYWSEDWPATDSELSADLRL